ncbi:MAG: ribosome small subunit-dependent GTPase A [Oligoflexia bacterium]|nr:ribosome small subunit-dependent GTPase A [Oligoflexia bacterium]
MNKSQLGWCDFWADYRNQSVARVTSVQKNLYKALNYEGEIICHLPGKFTYGAVSKSDYPTVGDWVELSPLFIDENGSKAALIHRVLPRKTKISRVEPGSGSTEEQLLAANIDYVFIVCSINQDLSINRMQRYILLAKSGGAKPVLLISKVDLVKDYLQIVKEIQAHFSNDVILPISVELNLGLERLNQYLEKGKTIVVVGSSGVGKSTLVNYLLGENKQLVSAIRESDGKGRHTTTSRELLIISNGAILIDSPGLREVHILGDGSAIEDIFSSIADMSTKCRFSNCTHNSEPGCAISIALELGDIEHSDYANYQKMKKELEYSNRKIDKKMAANSKKKWKKINTDMKKRRKFESENF